MYYNVAFTGIAINGILNTPKSKLKNLKKKKRKRNLRQMMILQNVNKIYNKAGNLHERSMARKKIKFSRFLKTEKYIAFGDGFYSWVPIFPYE